MSTDATTDGRTTDDPQTDEAADSAAERLGGPSETEERLDMRSEEETGARRQADTANMTTDTDTTRGAEVATEANRLNRWAADIEPRDHARHSNAWSVHAQPYVLK